MKHTLLIDGNALAHRAYHGINRGFVPMHNGIPVGMLYGFCSSIVKLLNSFDVEYVYCTFDTPEPTFRHKLLPEYKGKRSKTPDDFYPQIPLIKEFLTTVGIPIFEQPGYESDDIIGILTDRVPSDSIIIVSGDMDFTQLVSDRVSLLKWNGSLKKSIIYTPKEVEERYGIPPNQMIDYKGLVGDSSDNYIGARGIGPKTAMKLIQTYGSIDGIYANLNDLKPKVANILIQEKESVSLSRHLAEIIVKDESVSLDMNNNCYQKINDNYIDYFEKYKFFSIVRNFKKSNNSFVSNTTDVQKNSSKNSVNSSQISLF